MNMSHSPKAVANYVLQLGETEEIPLSPMKLQKLVYYAHGFHLAVIGTPLINEQVECWKFGPVIRSLFGEFKEFGSEPITRRASAHHVDIHIGDQSSVSRRRSVPDMSGADGATLGIIEDVWSSYKNYSAARLSNMTHLPETPWSRVMQKYNNDPPKGTDIPTEWIKEYFDKQLEKAR